MIGQLPRRGALLILMIAALPAHAFGAPCDGQYFAAQDNALEHPLPRPVPEFSSRLNKARAGDASEQRNLAISYELGYLVSKCDEKALYWYAKAAQQGDEAARNWLDSHQRQAARRSAPECAGSSCMPGGDDRQSAVLHADPRRGNHYFAPLTINGHRVEGMIDTGASMVAMSPETAKRLGINVQGGAQGRATTASGNISTTNVVVPLIEVAGIKLAQVPVSIGISGPTLIGMSFLRRLKVTMSDGALTLSK